MGKKPLFEVFEDGKQRRASTPQDKNGLERILLSTGKALGKAARATADFSNKHKEKFDAVVEPAALWAAANMAGIYTSDKILNYVDRMVGHWDGELSGGLAMWGTIGVLGAAAIYTNIKLMPKAAKKIFQSYKARWKKGVTANSLSYAKTLGIAGLLAAAVLTSPLERAADNLKYDAKRMIKASMRNLPTDINYESLANASMLSKEQLVFDNSKLAKKRNVKLFDPNEFLKYHRKSLEGRFYRTFRWHHLIEEAEKRYGIPQGLYAGKLMRESCGDPFALGEAKDGGAGLPQFQPGTAQDMGLHTYGESKNTHVDRNHYYKLVDMMRNLEYDYDEIRKKDERFDIVKAIDAGAKYFANRKQSRNNTWHEAISAYNLGTPANKRKHPVSLYNTNHVQYVLHYQIRYLEMAKQHGIEVDENYLDSLKRAQDWDFEDLETTNSKGKQVIKYYNKPSESHGAVACRFNDWDELYNNDEYADVDSTAVTDVRGNYTRVLETAKPGYVLADKK